jgi:hypothetical protein
MQKKNYENSNISPSKNISFKKILQKKAKSFKISRTLYITHLKFQYKPKYPLSKILI